MLISLLLAAAPAAVVTAPAGYAEAERRALAYDSNAAGTAWDVKQLYPALVTPLPPIMQACQASTGESGGFRMVVSYEKGVFNRVFLDRDTKLARCIAQAVAGFPLPEPPTPDYAERINFPSPGSSASKP